MLVWSSAGLSIRSARSTGEEPAGAFADWARIRAWRPVVRYLANCVEMIDLFLACVKIGVIFVPINILYRGREIAHIVEDAEPRAVVSETDWTLAEIVQAAAGLSDRGLRFWWMAMLPRASFIHRGRTGTSKGAVLTHHNFAINATNLVACWSITAADRFLLALPLFHVHGLGNGIHCWLVSGCRMRLLERFDQRSGRG